VDALRNPTMGLTLIFNSSNQPRVVTDATNRIVAIGDATMVPMPAKAVRDMFTKMQDAEVIENGTINTTQDTLPTAAELKAITKEDLAA
jgi:hypothetical protein